MFRDLSSPVWLTQVIALAPAPNAQLASFIGPGSVGLAGRKAFAWPVRE
jgi:hypothetical protein